MSNPEGHNGFNQTIRDLLYPDERGARFCIGCGKDAERGHLDPCPVDQLETLHRESQTLRDKVEQMRVVDLEVPDVHPLYRDPFHGWMCLRHGDCQPVLTLRQVDMWNVTFPLMGPTRMVQHTYSPLCDGIHDPGPCP